MGGWVEPGTLIQDADSLICCVYHNVSSISVFLRNIIVLNSWNAIYIDILNRSILEYHVYHRVVMFSIQRFSSAEINYRL